MGWFSNIFASKTKNWFYSQLPESQGPALSIKTVTSNEEYLSIFLKSMRIVNVRKGLSNFYPTVHSHIEVPHIAGTPASFNFVSTPGTLEKLDGAHVDRIINLNRRLLGPVPYRGATVKLEVGLFSIKEADLAAPFIGLLSDMSTLGGVSFIGMALPYVEPLEKGIELLTGSNQDTILEIGINVELTEIKTGYYVIMRADKNDIKIQDLRIDANDFRLTDKSGKSIEDYPYMVLEISASKSRNDWFSIPDVSAAYNKLREYVQTGKSDEAKAALTSLRLILLTSPDLLFKDAKVIFDAVKTETDEFMEAMHSAERGFSLAPKEKRELKMKELKEFNNLF